MIDCTILWYRDLWYFSHSLEFHHLDQRYSSLSTYPVIPIPSMYWACYSTVTSRKQSKGTTLDLRQVSSSKSCLGTISRSPHRVFFGRCTTEGAQNYYSAFIISRNLSARTSWCWASVLRKNVIALVLLTFIGNVNKRLKCLKLCSKNLMMMMMMMMMMIPLLKCQNCNSGV